MATSATLKQYIGGVWTPVVVGAVGPQGATGSQGNQGFQGNQGNQGTQGAGYSGLTSVTSTLIGTGSKVFATNLAVTANAFGVGSRVRVAYTTTPANYMEGVVTAYAASSMTVLVDKVGGSGTFALWSIRIAGDVGAQGSQGAAGAQGAQGASVALSTTTPAALAAAAAVGTGTTAAKADHVHAFPTAANVGAAPSGHVGSGGTSHANAVAAGAAGFMTGADKSMLDGLYVETTANAYKTWSCDASGLPDWYVNSPAGDMSNWKTAHADRSVVGMLGWGVDGHVIFDASSGLNPAGGVLASNQYAQMEWIPGYPTLMGWDGVNTFPVMVENANYCQSASMASTASNANFAAEASISWSIYGGVAGSIAYQSATNVTAFTAAGSAGQVLMSNGAGAPTWGTAGGEVSLAGTQTLSNKTITGLKETKVAMAANDIALASGNVFTKVISTNTTLTVSGVPAAGTVASFILELTNGGSFATTWWSNVKWVGGAPPVLTALGVDSLGFFTHNGGTTWTGLVLGKDIR